MFQQLQQQLNIDSIYDLDQLSPAQLKQALQAQKIPSIGLRSDSANDIDAYKAQCRKIADIAYHWPSAGLVAVMHMHVVLAFARYPKFIPYSQIMLEDIAKHESLLASLSAEGAVQKQQGFAPLLHQRMSATQFHLNGIKKPASLSHIADYFACMSREASSQEAAMVIIPRNDKVKVDASLWDSEVFNAADTQAVQFDNVMLSADQVADEGSEVIPVMSLALGTFQYMTIQCYLGIAQRLIDKISATFKPYYELRAAMARVQMFSATMCDVIAQQSFNTDTDEGARQFVQSCRYHLQRDIEVLVSNVHKHMSATALVTDKDFAHLMNTLMMLSFHPVAEKSAIREFMPQFNG
ncbi:hypothetical protein [Shewanella waksmanii]|uniref:hypothetical protein n=1 Tax=Shewanella waksmanii TaxID=213783 RepID=UPI0037363C2B